MRTGTCASAAALNPRSHFLVILTVENLSRRPLDLPIFEVVDGRRGRLIDCRSPEGRRILVEGKNVLYIGAKHFFEAPVQNVGIRDVLVGLRATLALPCGEPEAPLRAGIDAHIAELARPPAPASAPGAAA